MKKLSILTLALFIAQVLTGQSARIGDILCTDGSTISKEDYPASGKTAEGVVFYVDPAGTHGWAVSLDFQAVNTHWTSQAFYYSEYDIPGLPNYEFSRDALFDLNGYQNTGIIRATHDASYFPAAWCVDYEHGWYLPAAGQLRWMVSYFTEINQSLAVVGGSLFVHDLPRWFWSSTERSSMHAVVISETGSVGNYPKYNYLGTQIIGVRAIKDFTMTPSPQNHYIGETITVEGGQKGVVYYINPENDSDIWLAALNDLPGQYPWGLHSNVGELEDLNGDNVWQALHYQPCGYDATSYLRIIQQANPQYAAGQVDILNGWHLPSSGQISKLFAALPFIEPVILANGGATLTSNEYWTCSEHSSANAWCLGLNNPYSVGIFRDHDKNDSYSIRPVWSHECNPQQLPFVGVINNPNYICANDPLPLQNPECHFAIAQGWQLSPTLGFEDPVSYHGEAIGTDKDGWYLRYFATNSVGTVYSNTVIIHVKPSYETSFDATTCSDYEWNDITYSETGVYTQHLYTMYGCDSLVTMNLQVNSANEKEVFLSGCDSIEYGGITYTQSGHYEQLIAGSTGCDTLVNLYLSISPSPLVGEINGETDIYYMDYREYTYHIDPVPGAYGYSWSIDTPWTLSSSFNSPECTVMVGTRGRAVLTVRVFTDCGYVERSLLIRHDHEPGFTIFPNPTDNDVTIGLYGMKGPTVIRIHDTHGQFIHQFTVDTNLEGTYGPYSLVGKTAGVYYFTIINNYDVFTKKVLKKTPTSYGVREWWW